MSLAFVFPGQGEQKVGMGKDIYDAYPGKRFIFNNANEILNENIGNLCFKGNYDDLIDSRISGLATFLVSSLIYEIIKDLSLKPSGYAGYSLGQYTALYASGAFSFEQTLRLVNSRGNCLKKAAMANETGMLGVIGLSEEVIGKIVARVDKSYIANYNSPGNYSVSYDRSVRDMLFSEFEKENAMKITDIPVAGGWHSPFMKMAANMFREELFCQKIKLPHENFIENYTADQVKSTDRLKDNLYHHIYCPVKWHQSVRRLIELGIDTFVEVGFGNQLSKFIKYTNRKVKVLYTGTVGDLDKTIEILSKSS
jgi:[acyl-carrier-protein] S-malonyltransferase